MFHKLLKNRILLTLVLSSLVVGILFLCTPILQVLDKQIQNNYYVLKNIISPREVSENIVIATIDKKTLEQLGRFPFERSVYGDFIKNADWAGVGTIGFDIIFSDTTSDAEDDSFVTSIEKTSIPIVFWLPITGENELEFPLQKFQTHISEQWFLPPNIQTSNRTVYSFSPYLEFDDSGYEHFWLSTLRGFYNYLYQRDTSQGKFSPGEDTEYSFTSDISIPLAHGTHNDVLISFVPSERFRTISFVDFLDREALSEYNLRDTIVLVGTAVDGIKDEFFTPYGLEYGVFIHANIINTILTKNFLVYFDRGLEWVMIFLVVVLSVYFNLTRSRKVLILSNLIIVILFAILIPLGIFVYTNLVMNYLAEILLALILSQTLSNGVKYLIEDKNKQRLKQSLSEYVGSDIAHEVLEEEGKVNFDGAEKAAILFFSDIEGFTSMSEKLTPRRLVGFLREYLSQMSHVIMEERGYINKYEWDAIMALWGVFSKLSPRNYKESCKVALKQLELLKILNKDWLEHYGHQINIRIGIHSGDVIVGNIWLEWKKMEFTALWDTVNIASRLEWVNKFYGTSICVSHRVYEHTCEDFEYRYIDNIMVKWKTETLKIYELLGHKNSLNRKQKTIYKKFQIALDTYFQQDFQQAKLLFNELVNLWDKPSLTFKSRCSMYLLHPPEKDWDGVWKMEAK